MRVVVCSRFHERNCTPFSQNCQWNTQYIFSDFHPRFEEHVEQGVVVSVEKVQLCARSSHASARRDESRETHYYHSFSDKSSVMVWVAGTN